MKRKTLFNCLLSVLFGIFFLEFCIRIMTIFMPRLMDPLAFGGAHPRNLIIQDKELGYLLRPNFQTKETNDYKEYLIDVRINSLGLRDYEHDLSKNTYRILGIGDSYTFGEGAQIENTYLSVLEKELKNKYGQDIEIFKAGIPGYSTKQEVGFLKRYITLFKPKVVIMGLLPVEAFRSEYPYTYCHGYIVDSRKVDTLYLVSGKLYSSKAKNKVLARLDCIRKHYYLTPQFVRSRFKFLSKKLRKKKPEENEKENSENPETKYTLTFSLLKEYKQICLAHGAQPVIVLIEGDPVQDNYIMEFTSRIGIPTLSLYPYFKELAEKNIPYHFKHDLHWNVTGHEIAAKAIFEFLISNNIIHKQSAQKHP